MAAGVPITGPSGPAEPAGRGSVFNMGGQDVPIHRRVIQELLRPDVWYPPEDRTAFFLRGKEVNELCGLAENVLQVRCDPGFFLPPQPCCATTL